VNKIRKEVISVHFEAIDKSVLYKILKILISNSLDAAIENNKEFQCEVYYSDEIKIPENIKNQYKISIPVNEWNARKEFYGDSFSNYILKSYPLLDNDIEIIEKSIIYKPKLIFTDRCGGIKKDIEEKIFYPFFSTKKNHSGIGLNLLKKIIKELKGDFELINNPGIGINVNIFF